MIFTVIMLNCHLIHRYNTANWISSHLQTLFSALLCFWRCYANGLSCNSYSVKVCAADFDVYNIFNCVVSVSSGVDSLIIMVVVTPYFFEHACLTLVTDHSGQTTPSHYLTNDIGYLLMLNNMRLYENSNALKMHKYPLIHFFCLIEIFQSAKHPVFNYSSS